MGNHRSWSNFWIPALHHRPLTYRDLWRGAKVLASLCARKISHADTMPLFFVANRSKKTTHQDGISEGVMNAQLSWRTTWQWRFMKIPCHTPTRRVHAFSLYQWNVPGPIPTAEKNATMNWAPNAVLGFLEVWVLINTALLNLIRDQLSFVILWWIPLSPLDIQDRNDFLEWNL